MIESQSRRLTSGRTVLTLSLSLAMSETGPVLAADPLTRAIQDGSATLDTRYRYELVDQDNIPDDARASTLRAALGYRTGEVEGFSGFLEAEHVTSVGPETFNSTINGNTTRPVVADPTETEINQAYLRYAGVAFNLRLPPVLSGQCQRFNPDVRASLRR